MKSTTTWDRLIRRLHSSRHGIERQNVFLGTHAEYGYPILIDLRLLREHMHIIGDSGSGKTSRIVAPLATQLIRLGQSSIVVVDLKGDPSLLQTVRAEAEHTGRTFKYFTNVLDRSSYLFNPYQQLSLDGSSVSQFVETLMESLRLNHGDGYGSRFFTSQIREFLLKTVKRFPNLTSFRELLSKATPEFFKNEAEMDRCREAISVIQQLAEVIALNWIADPGAADIPSKSAIFMPDVVSKNQIIYFWLPAIGETSTVKEIANLALYSLLAATKAHKEAGGASQTYLFIDEVQQMASEGFKLILRQARSFNLSLILSNQSEADLISRQMNRLLDTVRANTQVKVYLSVNDQQTAKALEKGAGLLSYRGLDSMVDYRPRLTINDIRSYSAHPDYCICVTSKDAGCTAYGGDWFGVRTYHHITRAEYERRESEPWPAVSEETIVATRKRLELTPQLDLESKRVCSEFGGAVENVSVPPVPKNSAWATKLNEIFHRRSDGEVGSDVPA